MFRFHKEQKVFKLAGIEIGGQPGERPPFLIASMFHNKDKIMADRKGNFDRQRAAELLKQQETLSASTGIPGMLPMLPPVQEAGSSSGFS